MQDWKPDPEYDRLAHQLETALQMAAPAYRITVGRWSHIMPDNDPAFMEYQRSKFTVRAVQGDYGCDVPVSRGLIEHEPLSLVTKLMMDAIRRVFARRDTEPA